jgi:hypothetical protein
VKADQLATQGREAQEGRALAREGDAREVLPQELAVPGPVAGIVEHRVDVGEDLLRLRHRAVALGQLREELGRQVRHPANTGGSVFEVEREEEAHVIAGDRLVTDNSPSYQGAGFVARLAAGDEGEVVALVHVHHFRGTRTLQEVVRVEEIAVVERAGEEAPDTAAPSPVLAELVPSVEIEPTIFHACLAESGQPLLQDAPVEAHRQGIAAGDHSAGEEGEDLRQ